MCGYWCMAVSVDALSVRAAKSKIPRKRPGGYYDPPSRVTCDKQHARGGEIAEALGKLKKNTLVDLRHRM